MKIKFSFLLLALISIVAVPALAQDVRKQNLVGVETRLKTWDKSQDTAQLPPQKTEVLRRPPIKHVPFEMLDYRTKTPKPMKADELMAPFPDGRRQMTAGEYYKELNRIEKDLNGIGHTLRDKDKKSILIGRTLHDKNLITRQTQDIKRRLKPRTPINILTEPLEKPRHIQIRKSPVPLGKRTQLLETPVNPVIPVVFMKTASPFGANPGETFRNENNPSFSQVYKSGVVPGTPAYEQNLLNGQIPLSKDIPIDKFLLQNPEHFNLGFGDPSIVAAGFSAWVEHSLTGDDVTMGAFANGGMSLIGQNFNLLDAAAWATSGPTRNAADGHVVVLGQNLLAPFHIDQAGPIDKVLDHQAKSVEQSVKFHMVIGIIPIAVAIGGRGEVGYDARLVVRNRSVQVEFDPYVEVAGFVEAGVDIVIAGAGIYGNFVIIKDTVHVWGQMGFKGKVPPPLSEPGFPSTLNGSTLRLYDAATRPQFYFGFGADNYIELFSGSVGIYAYIYVPDCCFPPWTKLEYRHDLVSWTGPHSGPDRIFGTDEVPLYLTRPLTQQELIDLKRQVELGRGFGKLAKEKLPAANTPAGTFGKSPGFASKSETVTSANSAFANRPASTFNPAPGNASATANASPFATNSNAKAQALAPVRTLSNAPFKTLPALPPKGSFTEQSLANKLEANSNRLGGDYASGNVASAQICQLVCSHEAQCKSWTFDGQNQGQCLLKNVVPARIKSASAISGIK
jgi:hypothetical protein